MAGRKWMDYLNLAVNILVVLLVAGFMLRPGGPVGDWIAERRQRAAVEQQIRAVWPELIKGARVDDGPPAAKLVVLFSDYQCPGCRQAHFRIAELARETGVGVILRHTPNTTSHPMAHDAARAAICADRQGRFRAMSDYLFTDTEWQRTPMWASIAAASAVPDTAAFLKCLVDPTVARQIAEDLMLAERIGYRGTPTFVGPRGMILGIPTPEALWQLVD